MFNDRVNQNRVRGWCHLGGSSLACGSFTSHQSASWIQTALHIVLAKDTALASKNQVSFIDSANIFLSHRSFASLQTQTLHSVNYWRHRLLWTQYLQLPPLFLEYSNYLLLFAQRFYCDFLLCPKLLLVHAFDNEVQLALPTNLNRLDAHISPLSRRLRICTMSNILDAIIMDLDRRYGSLEQDIFNK